MQDYCPITSDEAIRFAQDLRGQYDNELFRKTYHQEGPAFWSKSSKDESVSTQWMRAGLTSYIAFGALCGCDTGEFPVRFKFRDSENRSVDKGVITAWVKHACLSLIVNRDGLVVGFKALPKAFEQLNEDSR